MSPQRVQRQRTKGWRMPPDAVYVGRPSPWGNEWTVGQKWFSAETLRDETLRDRADCVRAYRQDVGLMFPDELTEWLAPLQGKTLVCWCPLDQPCHADVLAELLEDAR